MICFLISDGFLVLNVSQFGICDAAFTLQTPSTSDCLKWLEQFRLAKVHLCL